MNKKRLANNLVALIIVLVCISFFYVYTPNTSKKSMQKSDTLIGVNNRITFKKENTHSHINTNTATFNELLNIGFGKKQAYNCLNFRKAGGIFYSVNDLQKLYSLSKEDYLRIKSYIHIPKKINNEFDYKTSNSLKKIENKKIKTKIDLNTCDTTLLKTIPGIGSFRAKKLIEYRNKLGGYFEAGQLFSVYSIDSNAVASIKKYCFIDTAHIQKININEAGFKELNSHPLINYYQAKNICEYKKISGTLKNIEELKDNNIVTAKEFEILKYYIKTF